MRTKREYRVRNVKRESVPGWQGAGAYAEVMMSITIRPQSPSHLFANVKRHYGERIE